MKFSFDIKNPLTQKLWNSFERELKHKLKSLPQSYAEDTKLEIQSHLYDSFTNETGESEQDRMIKAIDKLGAPEEYLDPLVKEFLMYENIRRGKPRAILSSLLSSLQSGVLPSLFAIGFGFLYFIIIMIFLLGVVHIFQADAGLWLHQQGGWTLSFEYQPNSTQWLPRWFSILSISFSLISYWILNKLLYLIIAKKKK